jgi:ATP-dependent DNA helicase RecG
MGTEHAQIDFKSLRKAHGPKADLDDLAASCVCFANAQGGLLIIGIEDKESAPPPEQRITEEVMSKVVNQLRSRTDSVGIADAEVVTYANGGQYVRLRILPSSRTIATTSNGRVFIRIEDQCHPVTGDELTRLAAEKNAFQWELVEARAARVTDIAQDLIHRFTERIRNSKRVKAFVKEMHEDELLEHYALAIKGGLTNLGVLWLGTPAMRARIAYPLTIQYIVHDRLGNKVRKEAWHDHRHDPQELILEVERQATELRYYHEFPQGLFRKRVMHYAPEVVRELLVNAVAHRKYTISGDIFVEVHPDRMEVTSPGALPLGVTEANILHQRHRRNPNLIRILHDLELMEGEGSGYDLIYELDSKDGKPFPEVHSGYDLTRVTQKSTVLDPALVQVLGYVVEHFELSQKNHIALGMVLRSAKLAATDLAKALQLTGDDRLRTYTERLLDQEVILPQGQGKGTAYIINPKLIHAAKANVRPTLRTIEQHRLRALIEEDLKRHPDSERVQIQERLPDVEERDIRKALFALVDAGIVIAGPGRKHRKYRLAENK